MELTVCCWSSLSFARPQRIDHIGHILKLACQRKQWSVHLVFDKGLTENQGNQWPAVKGIIIIIVVAA